MVGHVTGCVNINYKWETLIRLITRHIRQLAWHIAHESLLLVAAEGGVDVVAIVTSSLTVVANLR